MTLESFNLASVWKLPVIFVCENNQFGISVSTKKSTSVKDIAVRAEGFGMPGHIADGNDVFAIDETFEKALEHAKAGKGPSLIEFKTYRWKGHWTGDPEVYRTREEVDEWKKKCPILRLKDQMLKDKTATKKQLEEIESRVDALIAEAEEFSMDSPEPDPAHVLDDVFCCE